MTEPEYDYKAVEDEEILTAKQLGYSGDEDFTPDDLKAEMEEELTAVIERDEDIEDTNSPDDDGVETASKES